MGAPADSLFPAIAPGLHHLVIFTNNDDWQALFKDGVLVEQAHEIVPNDLARYCPIASIRYEDIPLETIRYLYEVGQFPDGISLEAARTFGPEE